MLSSFGVKSLVEYDQVKVDEMRLERASGPSVRGLWALAWRSVILLPLARFILFCTALVALVTLPIYAGVYIWYSEWWLALTAMALWLVSCLVVRWFWRWEQADDNVNYGRF
jgi:hypothetical protein